VLLGAVQSFSDQPLDDLTVVVLKQIGAPVRGSETAPENSLKYSSTAADASR
jgi:hypothetical protein